MLRMCECGKLVGCMIGTTKVWCGHNGDCALARTLEVCDRSNPQAVKTNDGLCDECRYKRFLYKVK